MVEQIAALKEVDEGFVHVRDFLGKDLHNARDMAYYSLHIETILVMMMMMMMTTMSRRRSRGEGRAAR